MKTLIVIFGVLLLSMKFGSQQKAYSLLKNRTELDATLVEVRPIPAIEKRNFTQEYFAQKSRLTRNGCFIRPVIPWMKGFGNQKGYSIPKSPMVAVLNNDQNAVVRRKSNDV